MCEIVKTAMSRLARLPAWLALAACILFARTGWCGEHSSKADREAAVKAGIVLNFIRFTEWPADAFTSADSTLTVTVLGEGDISKYLDEILATQRVHGRAIEIHRLQYPPEVTEKDAPAPEATQEPTAAPTPEPSDAADSTASQPGAEGTPEKTTQPRESAEEPDATTGSGGEFLQTLRTSHVLFVCDSESARLQAILEHVQGEDILTVSDIPKFAEHGGMLGLTVRRGRVAFDANTDPIDATRLKVSSQLLRLARLATTKES